jgi:hypothetical protein
MHNLRVCVSNINLEGSQAIEIDSLDMIIATCIDKLILFENGTYQTLGEIAIPLLKTESREPNEIIGIQKSEDEQYLAIISGKNLIMDE